MTTVYFVRHAQPNYENHNDAQRELTPKGMADREQVTAYLQDKNIDVVFSSPYKRAIQTVAHFSEINNLPIILIPDFRERKVESGWIDDFDEFCFKQWENFEYKRLDGESLREVQERNICALSHVLEKCDGKNILIGSHGTALSTIINFYDSEFGYDDFRRIKDLMPWIVILRFENKSCVEIRQYNIFEKTHG